MGDIGYSKRQMRSHTPISTASSSNVFIANGHDLRNNDQYDSQIPTHEDIYDNPSDGIFTNVSYDDEGAVADFTNLETTVNVRAYYSRQSRITLHASIHLKLLEIHLSIHRQGAKYTKIEPKKISQVIKDGSWVDAMQEELLQFKKIQESFVDPKFPKKVYKVIKALYGLHQAFKASYASLSTFLLKSGYRRGTIVKNSFHQRQDRMISVWVQIHDWLFNVPLRGAVLGLILCLHRACINDLGFGTLLCPKQSQWMRSKFHAYCFDSQRQVLDLETAKDAQAAKILKLNIRIKKLEKKCKPSISHHRAWLKSVKRLSIKKRLGKKEPIAQKPSWKHKPRRSTYDYMVHRVNCRTEGRAQVKETMRTKGSKQMIDPVTFAGNIGVSTAVNISTASRPEVSTATPMTPPTTTVQSVKGVEIKEKKDAERPARSVLTFKPLLKIDPKDKGKGVLEEEPEPVKVKSKDQGEAQIERDAKIALKVQAELDEEVRLERQRTRASIFLLHCKIYERATLLAKYFENRKKPLAEERAAAIRNKPLTKSQLRSLMMTYL
ncbi:hypothetical protein Tco_0528529 [Tanacetum coccineum]